MQRQSPPKHKHDGTSPLPLGMDWSPPPRNWVGRETVWPHDPRTGWSYCVTLPSWIVLAKSRDSDPIVFYRVQVGIQSPEGVTTTRTLLRRFNDFLKLHAALKRTLPGKNIPPTPPKGLLQMKTKTMLETRKRLLEEWMTKLLSDIDLSRSIVVASFLELEAAARSSFQEGSQPSLDAHTPSATDPALHVLENSSLSMPVGSSSLASDYGSDTAYETSEIGSPSLTANLGRDNNSELSLDELSFYNDITSEVDKFVKQGMSNIDEGLSMGHSIMEKLENFPRHKLSSTVAHYNSERDMNNASPSKAFRSEPDLGPHHVRKLSSESIGSDRSSDRGSEMSNSAFPNSNGHGILDFRSWNEDSRRSRPAGDSEFLLSDDVQLLVPMDQRQNVKRVLMTLQRRLITAKTDVEDLISRLNQEITVKDYLVMKVKDLEVELETTKQKSKANLEQAILIERERVTQMQWDMEELRQRSMELELKLNSKQAQSSDTQSMYTHYQQDFLPDELISTKQLYEDLLKRHQELEVKSKADTRVLVKEVKSLRASHSELTKQLDQMRVEKSKAEEQIQEEIAKNERTRTSWREFLYIFKTLHEQLQECHTNSLKKIEGDDKQKYVSSFSEPVDIMSTSDNRMTLLISQVQHLARALTGDKVDDERSFLDEEWRQMLTSILVDNGMLRKQLSLNKLNGKGQTDE